MRALVGLGTHRMAMLPDVPTMKESGLPDLQVITWNGLVAPAGTPDAIVARLNASINEALKTPSIRDTLAKFSSEPLGGTPAGVHRLRRHRIEEVGGDHPAGGRDD